MVYRVNKTLLSLLLVLQLTACETIENKIDQEGRKAKVVHKSPTLLLEKCYWYAKHIKVKKGKFDGVDHGVGLVYTCK